MAAFGQGKEFGKIGGFGFGPDTPEIAFQIRN
jgi:hypothetical protein